MQGIKRSVIDKYTEQAHFIYELLQNADDTKATYARFKLYSDKLVFAHNGQRRFSVSSPDTEEQDRANGTLGDVNAILSIGNSSKTSESMIGKFGVGFKAVFQYTSTPYIYDPGIFFKIERFIVPVLLDLDYSEREEKETLFVFPFNHDVTTPDMAFKAIADRLQSLVNLLLFLSNLVEINYEINDTKGTYQKKVEKEYYGYKHTKIKLISLVINNNSTNGKGEKEQLWILSRTDDNGRSYSVGFFLDMKGRLRPVQQCAYCFFPTRETTGLNFIIHAPFLLTDSREGIKTNEEHNKWMMDLLADLAADVLVYLRDIGIQEETRLIDDDILSIVPTRSFSEKDWFGRIVKISAFEPFYEKILNKFKSEQIIPAKKTYVTAQNAYWARSRAIISVFDDEALQAMTNNSEAHWVFRSLRQDNDYYIDKITDGKWFDEEKIFGKISKVFIENRSVEWLAEFYNWIDDTNSRKNSCKTLPIFLDKKGKAVPAYDTEGKLVLFFPTDDDSDYMTVSEQLMANVDIMAFLKSYGITKPALKNEIYNKILPIFKKNDTFYSGNYFKKLFEYYRNECPPVEQDSYITKLRSYDIVRYSTAEQEGYFRGRSNDSDTIYFPTEELMEYFKVKPSTKFVDIDGYIEIVGKENEKFLRSFLIELGVSEEIRIINRQIDSSEARNRKKYRWAHSNGQDEWNENIIDGCSENIRSISINKITNKSISFWNTMVKLINNKNINLNDKLKGVHKYHFRSWHQEFFESINVDELRNKKWLCTRDGKFVCPLETYADNLAEGYDISTPAAKRFIDFLKMPYENPELSHLSPEQRSDIEIARKLKESGISADEIDDMIALYSQKKQLSQNVLDTPKPENSSSFSDTVHHNFTETVSRPKRVNDTIASDITDSDEYTPKTVDYQKKIERAKSKRDAELDLIEKMEELQQKAMESKRYTYGWFKALLELEALDSAENHSDSREVSISFGKVEQESATIRTLILKQPSCYIPRFMEELSDLPLILEFENETKKLPIEVINIRSYTLRVKLKPNADISHIDFSAVKEARITAQNPVFLLEELMKQFAGLELEDDYDMQKNLCHNIDFIFGPPGTGKTTYLAKEVIVPKMKCDEDIKVLVLTPTNKAADVIVRKIQEVMAEDNSYLNWLIRFGGTDDEEIERVGIYRDKTFDIRDLGRCVTVTTIDRFSYDFFMPNGERHYLRNQSWDYIIFDEASMIPLVKIIYPLYLKKQPRSFIVAGDPFQIEPVVALDLWKGENIYTMVKLNSFANPATIPYKYNVKLLTIQYRSIPLIGEIFSRLTYDGILEHNRSNDSCPSLNIENIVNVKPLNIIKFPVSKYESIYRSKQLGGTTPYQIYSALFAYEFTTWIAASIGQNNTAGQFNIGVIAAYKAQADLIDRLISSAEIPKNISIQTGTIHGFQGDECEIVITVYNPPPSISNKKEMFLNKKNIINVSISRAKDYLFVLMPDDNTEGVDNLSLIKQLEQYIKESTMFTEYDSHAIEYMIFRNSNYLEENCFSTSHQRVNVYGLPEQKYEIRSEEDTIDIQIRDSTNHE